MTKKPRRRRVWADDEKRMICRQALVAGVSVSQVARRYDVNANLVFNWLRDVRYAPPEAEAEAAVTPDLQANRPCRSGSC
ncbi:transposase [uncultured Jannaschia sp.]|uniref:transposase n=1 Tax=uncultured Jannaschia sp. TaxID=293347 RepID=UPI00262EC0A5|nr:transposase [uncultured Jannaschia sp.]